MILNNHSLFLNIRSFLSRKLFVHFFKFILDNLIPMEIDTALVERIARIARLRLEKKDKEKYAEELESILKNFEIIKEADVKSLEPAFQPIDIKNVMRSDKATESIPREDILSNTRNKESGYFKGPKTIEW